LRIHLCRSIQVLWNGANVWREKFGNKNVWVANIGIGDMNYSIQPKRSADRQVGTLSLSFHEPARSRRLRCLSALFMVISISLLNNSICPGQSATENQVKAAYLFNFLKFVEWPDGLSSDPQSKWIIGIVGGSPVSFELSKLVEGKNILGRELLVKNFQATDNLRGCNILFIGGSEKKHLPSILASLRGSSVMTVADMDHFIESGGMVQIVVENARARVSIDMEATDRAGLKISSKLLALARTVVAEGSAKN